MVTAAPGNECVGLDGTRRPLASSLLSHSELPPNTRTHTHAHTHMCAQAPSACVCPLPPWVLVMLFLVRSLSLKVAQQESCWPLGTVSGQRPSGTHSVEVLQGGGCGRLLVTLIERENAASAGLFPFGSQRREVCILWKGVGKHPGPRAKPLFPQIIPVRAQGSGRCQGCPLRNGVHGGSSFPDPFLALGLLVMRGTGVCFPPPESPNPLPRSGTVRR